MNETEPPAQPSTSTLCVAGWDVHTSRNLIVKGEQSVRLEPRIMAVLSFLSERPGEVITRQQLEEAVWPGQVVGYDALSNTIVKLRKVFGDDRNNPQIIETIPKVGYRFIADFSPFLPNGESPIRAHRVLLEPGSQSGPRSRRYWAVTGIAALAIVGAGALAWLQPWAPNVEPASQERMAFPLPDTPSIAVLPFTNMSGDPEQEYFSDGITESIITTLARIPGLFVIARNSTFTYKGKAVKVDEVASDLGVRYVLEGSVQRAGSRLRITAQLIDTKNGSHILAERYDRELGDIFSVQDDVAKSIATALAAELTEGDLARISSEHTSSLEAYEYYLQGKNIPAMFTPESNERAKELLNKALDLDAKFVDAIVELAWKHTMAARFGWTDDVVRAWATAAALNEQALSVNPESGQALYQAGYLTLYRGKDYERGVQMAAKGTMLAPSNFQVRGGYGWLLLASMRAEEAVSEFEQALRLSPKRPLWVVEALGRAHEMLGRYDDAAAAFEEVIERGQSTGRMTADSHAWLALIHAAQGLEDKAKNSMAKAMKALPKLSASQYRRRIYLKDPDALDKRIAVWQRFGLPE